MFVHTGSWGGRWGVGLLAALVAAGCSGEHRADTASGAEGATVEGPVVVATTSLLCDLTEQVAEATVALTCLLPPGTDPHTYQVKPSDRQALEQADLILYDGYNYAASVARLVQGLSTAAPRVAVYEAAVPTPLMAAPHDHDHDHGPGAEAAHDHEAEATKADHDNAHEATETDHDHAHEAAEADHDHDHEATAGAETALEPDPHIWHSAVNNGAIAAVIADNLAQVNPTEASRYRANANRLAEQFAAIDAWIAAQVATVPEGQRQLVTTHEAFGYFAEAYGFEVKGALSGLSTDEKPTPGTLTALVDQVKAAQVPAIFAETTTNPDLIEAVAREAGVTVAAQPLFVEGPGGPGSAAESTQAMLVVNTCAVVEALGGRCDRPSAPL